MQDDMTLFGPDISNVNFGGPTNPNLGAVERFVNALRGQAFSFLIAKASQGSDFIDPTFQTVAAWNTLPLVSYHFVDTSDPAAQAANYVKALDGVKAACMLDFEEVNNDGLPLLTPTDFWDVVGAFNEAGVTVALAYYPAWFADDIGADLSELTPNEIGLVSSNYPGGIGYAWGIYQACGGDKGKGWNTYNGGTPVIWQFTDQAQISGLQVDCNAFRGTLTGLEALLTG